MAALPIPPSLAQLRNTVISDSVSTEQAAKALEQIHGQAQDKAGEAAQAVGWTPELVTTLGLGILVFSILLIGLIGLLIYNGKIAPPHNDGQWLVRTLVIPICIIAAVFLVITGYSQDQIAPVIGLLGTIIGYLLGAGTRNFPEAPTPVVLPPVK